MVVVLIYSVDELSENKEPNKKKPSDFFGSLSLIEDEVNFNPFRDGGRDYVSSKKKADEKRGYLIFDDGSHRTYR